MRLVTDNELEDSPVVANCRMNRTRNLHGNNGYERDLRFDPLDFLKSVVARKGQASWLDLCCGTGRALVETAAIIDSESLGIKIVGVDLVGMFEPFNSPRLQLIEAPLSEWRPVDEFDLITCVHGLHYIGDKLGLIAQATTWLTSQGKFVANLDASNLCLQDGSQRQIMTKIRQAGFEYSSRHRILQSGRQGTNCFQLKYLGANDQAGPNYTGQAAVDSHYRLTIGEQRESV